MSKACLFPGQGSQFPGMGRAMYDKYPAARDRFDEAEAILNFNIAEIMFTGTAEALTQTSVTQPAIFLHSVILAEMLGVQKDMAMGAGHSLGEFSALTAAGALSFADGLKLVAVRAHAMQEACNYAPSTMAAIVGMDDAAVEALSAEAGGVVPANYNAPGQLVISGSVPGIEAAIQLAKSRGAKIAKQIQVNGAFHSPFMERARQALASHIASVHISAPVCPVYQNIDARPHTSPEEIRANLIAQLTAPVRWTATIEHMAQAGATEFLEVGPGKVLQGLVKRIAKGAQVSGVEE